MKQATKHNESAQSDGSVSFIATIPSCARAMDFHGDGGARLQLDIPDSEKAAALHVAAYMLGKRLRVRIEAD